MAPQQPFLKKKQKNQNKTQRALPLPLCCSTTISKRKTPLPLPPPLPVSVSNIMEHYAKAQNPMTCSSVFTLKQTRTTNTERNIKVKNKHPFTFSAVAAAATGECPERLLRHPDLNSAAPRLSGSSLRLLRQFGGGISEGGADRLANMFSGGICIMSAVHRQRSCSAPVPPLVIYLAVLLKCSCRWHWLTNQTVKTRPEYQSAAVLFLRGKKIFVCHPLLDCVLFKSS